MAIWAFNIHEYFTGLPSLNIDIGLAWFPFGRKCREHIKLTDVIGP